MKKWSRRGFLLAGVLGPVAVPSSGAARLAAPQNENKSREPGPVSAGLGTDEREVLRIAMDEIIPAGDGMPSASEVGSLDYLVQLSNRDASVAKGLQENLRALEGISEKHTAASFRSLPREKRIDALSALQREDEDAFKFLRDCIYEGYYTRPAVWKLIGYEFHPTNQSGPTMKPFDEALLSEVRKKPKYYREVRG